MIKIAFARKCSRSKPNIGPAASKVNISPAWGDRLLLENTGKMDDWMPVPNPDFSYQYCDPQLGHIWICAVAYDSETGELLSEFTKPMVFNVKES